MKSFTDIFIRRPILAIVVNVLIIIAGLQAWRSLSVRQYPRSENSTVTVSTVYVGASAEVVILLNRHHIPTVALGGGTAYNSTVRIGYNQAHKTANR